MSYANEHERELKKALKQSYYEGRSGFAVFADRVFWALLALFLLYLLIRPRYKNAYAAYAVTFCSFLVTASAAAAFGRMRFDLHVKKMYAATKDELNELRLLMRLGEIKAAAVLKEGEIFANSIDELTADDVLRALNTGNGEVSIISAGKPTNEALRLMRLTGGRVKTVHPRERFKTQITLPPVTKREVEDAIIAKQPTKTRRRIKLSDAAASVKSSPYYYIAAGAALFALSLFVHRALYLRLAAILCTSVGGTAAVVRDIRTKQKPDI